MGHGQTSSLKYSFEYTDEKTRKFKYPQVKHSIQDNGKEQQQNKQGGNNKGRNEIVHKMVTEKID